MNNKLRYIISLFLILIICWLGYTYTEEIKLFTSNRHKPFQLQFKRLLWLISIGVLTWWGFKKNTKKWLAQIVIITYILAVIIIGLLGLIEWKYKILGENTKEFISGIRLFLSSPLPFIFLWIMSSINLDVMQKTKTL